MKVYISQKNSAWKVSQSPIKGNFYKDVVAFESPSDRDTFLNRFVGYDWNNLNHFIDIGNPHNTDEIHFSFTTDLDNITYNHKLTRSEAMRKDFAIVWDENEPEKGFTFWTLQASIDPKGVYNKITYSAEMDLFFTYGIQNIWKDGAQVEIERGIPKSQWYNNRPMLNVDNGLINPEPIDTESGAILQSKQWLFDDDMRLLLIFKPQKRSIKTWVINRFNITQYADVPVELFDTIALKTSPRDNGVKEYLLFFETVAPTGTYQNYYGGYTNSKGDYTNFVAETYNNNNNIGPDNHYKKQDYFMTMLLDPADINNTFGENNEFSWGDLLTSPDLLKIIPVPKTATLEQTALARGWIVENSNGTSAHSINYPINYNHISGTGFRFTDIYVGTCEIQILNDYAHFTDRRLIDMWYSTQDNHLIDTNFHPNQYAKTWGANNFYWTLTNAWNQTMKISLPLLDYIDISASYLNYESVYSLEGTFSKISLTSGKYALGELRNEYTSQGLGNLQFFLGTDNSIKQILENASQINQQAKLQDKYAQQSKVKAGLRIAGGAIGSIAGLGSVKKAKSVMDGLSSVGAVLGGANAITSGVQDLQNASDNIKMTAAQIADMTSGKGEIINNGSEYERLTTLDHKNPYALLLGVYSLPTTLKQQVGMYYHKYGYSWMSILDKPKNWLGNGVYFDYLQTGEGTTYTALSESISPQEAKILALSLEMGVRVWWYKGQPDFVVGDYTKRNIKG